MKACPPVPRVDDAPTELFDGGHLWIQERIDGGQFRFRLSESGTVEFGDRTDVFDRDTIPAPDEHTVRHVRERLDRAALRSAVDSVEDVVFFGVSTYKRAVDYNWNRLPSFVGHDIWSGTEEAFLPPDTTEKVFDRLGLTPVNAFRKEVRAVDFDPETYAIPDSRWYDGTAAGVVLRNKTGLRAHKPDPNLEPADGSPSADFTAEELAGEWATDRRFQRIANGLEADGKPVTVDSLYDRVLEDIVREKHRELSSGTSDDELRAFRSGVAALTREFVTERR